MGKKIIIGSRGSDLALWQAHFVESELKKAGFDPEIKIIKTQGDIIQHLPFDKMEGKGFFTKEIEEALLNKSIDLAVHSHKDLETTNPPGLTICAVSERANNRDLLLIRKDSYNPTANLGIKPGGIIGTSAARRIAQLLRHFNAEQIKMLRGNVPTRIQKLRDGQYDAILVAAAGVERLEIDLTEFVVTPLEKEVFVSAPAQGFLGIQCREDEEHLEAVKAALHNEAAAEIVSIERGILKALQGGCQVPLGTYAEKTEQGFKLWVAYAKDSATAADQAYFENSDADAIVKEALDWMGAEKNKS